jgi:hypothetical protein
VNKFTVFLSFDKSNELKIKEYLNKIDECGEIIINESFEKSKILIFFLTKKYIESDQFKENWSKRHDKVILIVLLENFQSNLNLNEFFVSNFNNSTALVGNEEEIKRNKIFISRLINLKTINLNGLVIFKNDDLVLKKVGFLAGWHQVTTNLNCSNWLEFGVEESNLKKMDIIGDNLVILKTMDKENDEKILVINWRRNAEIIAEIRQQESRTGRIQKEFCWIDHLNLIFYYQNSNSLNSKNCENSNSDF